MQELKNLTILQTGYFMEGPYRPVTQGNGKGDTHPRRNFSTVTPNFWKDYLYLTQTPNPFSSPNPGYSAIEKLNLPESTLYISFHFHRVSHASCLITLLGQTQYVNHFCVFLINPKAENSKRRNTTPPTRRRDDPIHNRIELKNMLTRGRERKKTKKEKRSYLPGCETHECPSQPNAECRFP